MNLVNADLSSSDADDDVILSLELWEVIIILVIIVLVVIGFCITFGLVSSMAIIVQRIRVILL